MKEFIFGIEEENSDYAEVFYGWIRNHSPELIRCKDCKYFCAEEIEEHTPYGVFNTHWACWCDKHTDYGNQKYLEVNTDDYCSWAERKEE